jgi:Fe-S cluster biogenesis protein NfuA
MTDIENRICEVLKEVRPFLKQDGGDVEFVRFDEPNKVAEVRLTGMCKHCPMSMMTLRGGIERFILDGVPEVRRVEAV